MSNTKLWVLIFGVGMVVGVAATWNAAIKIYEKRTQEEIDSVKAKYKLAYEMKTQADKMKAELSKDAEDATADNEVQKAVKQAKEKPNILEYTSMLQKHGYVADSEEERKDTPYVIPPEQFGEIEDYTEISLTYFLDGVLADDDYEPVEDVDDVIGLKSLNHFGEYEDDSVFVRNDKLKCDYEILLDQRNYQDVLKTMPHRVEV